MLRSIAAVLAGLIATLALVIVLTYLSGVLSGASATSPPTPLYLGLNLVGGAIAGASGGAVAVRLAPHTPHGHMWALALVILILSLPIIFSAPSPGQPIWYGIVLSVLGPVSVVAGGLAAVRWKGPSE
ncbi:MAG: hypothetical protein GEU90_08995 [Gemmatimonas sp.]|nr:hypothetical protein [Gemmatimonas sp.]